MYKEICIAFVNMIDDCIADAKGFCESGSLNDAAIKIHAIKSQARTIGAFELGDFAEMLEKAAKVEDVKTIDDNVDTLFERCIDLKKSLEPLKDDGADTASSLPEISEEQLSEIYARLITCVEEYEIDSIEEIAEELKQYRIPESHADEVKELYHVIDNLDYEQIPEIIKSHVSN